MTRARTLVLATAVAVALPLAACSDDGADVRDLSAEDGGSSSASGSASGVASGSGSASGSGVAAAEKECEPVGDESEADTVVEVQLADYRFVPDSYEVPAGTIAFATENIGDEAHELAFLPGGGEVPFTEDGEPDEDALAEAGAFELEGYGPGRSCSATYDLEPGEYTIFCIIEAADGETHYEKGMVGTVTVS